MVVATCYLETVDGAGDIGQRRVARSNFLGPEFYRLLRGNELEGFAFGSAPGVNT